ncbi:MAG: acyltransferase family protein, partial [Myxococcota bacterium]
MTDRSSAHAQQLLSEGKWLGHYTRRVLASPTAAISGGTVERGPVRVAALTGMRGLAALLVLGTHAAFATGKLSHGYVGVMYARLEIGVAIFFVLSGFLLFRPWVRAAAAGVSLPSVGHYARRRMRRVMPAYL